MSGEGQCSPGTLWRGVGVRATASTGIHQRPEEGEEEVEEEVGVDGRRRRRQRRQLWKWFEKINNERKTPGSFVRMWGLKGGKIRIFSQQRLPLVPPKL